MTADHALVEKILTQTRVDATPPSPAWSGWLEALAGALMRWLREVLPGAPRLDALAAAAGPAAIVTGVVLVVVMLCLIVRLLRRGPRESPLSDFAGAVMVGTGPRPAAPRGRADWRREFDRRLAAGDVTGALRALWWWFAHGIAAERVDEAWTTRELLARSGRADLGGLGGTLDQWLYGARKPAVDELVGFLGRAEAALR